MNSNDLSKEMLFDLVVSHKKTIEQQADRIKELEKYVGFKDSGYDIIQLPQQTKPLSDEEIDDCVGRVALANDFYPEEIPSDRFLKCFARAIEERHGIK